MPRFLPQEIVRHPPEKVSFYKKHSWFLTFYTHSPPPVKWGKIRPWIRTYPHFSPLVNPSPVGILTIIILKRLFRKSSCTFWRMSKSFPIYMSENKPKIRKRSLTLILKNRKSFKMRIKDHEVLPKSKNLISFKMCSKSRTKISISEKRKKNEEM